MSSILAPRCVLQRNNNARRNSVATETNLMAERWLPPSVRGRIALLPLFSPSQNDWLCLRDAWWPVIPRLWKEREMPVQASGEPSAQTYLHFRQHNGGNVFLLGRHDLTLPLSRQSKASRLPLPPLDLTLACSSSLYTAALPYLYFMGILRHFGGGEQGYSLCGGCRLNNSVRCHRHAH